MLIPGYIGRSFYYTYIRLYTQNETYYVSPVYDHIYSIHI